MPKKIKLQNVPWFRGNSRKAPAQGLGDQLLGDTADNYAGIGTMERQLGEEDDSTGVQGGTFGRILQGGAQE